MFFSGVPTLGSIPAGAIGALAGGIWGQDPADDLYLQQWGTEISKVLS